VLFLDSVGSVAIHRSTPTTSYPPSATHHPPPTIRHLPLPPTVRPERSHFAAKSKGPQPRREASTSCLRHYAQHERLCRTTFFGRAQRLEYAARSGVNDHAFVLPSLLAGEGWGALFAQAKIKNTPSQPPPASRGRSPAKACSASISKAPEAPKARRSRFLLPPLLAGEGWGGVALCR
jgi:hypothetical protein